jgi:hypothetical protein
MCTFCQSILGCTKPHKESECALKQAAICPHCGPGLHFLEDCPIKPCKIPKQQKVLPSIQPADHPNELFMSSSNLVYIEYLKLHKQEYHVQLEKNRCAVEAHLATRGLRLIQPIEPSKKSSLVLTKDLHCKLIHGENEHCVYKELQQGEGKKKLLRKTK